MKTASAYIEYFTVEQAQAFLAALDMEYGQPVKERTRKDRNGNESKVAAYVNKVIVPLQFRVLFNINITKSTAYVERETFIKGTKTKLSNQEITMPSSVMKRLREYRSEYLKRQMHRACRRGNNAECICEFLCGKEGGMCE